MLFNSYVFILLFLPVCFTGYFVLNHFKKYNIAQAFVLAMSLWFYGYFNYSYVIIIVASILVNFFIYRLICKKSGSTSSKIWMITGVVLNLCVLGYFKYMDFFISNINSVFKTNFNLLHIILPLGISFFTFQQISFIVDAYHKEVPGYNFLHYASFVAFFPQLIAGPIVSHDELVPQFMDETRKKINFENLSKGIYIFALGLAKKVLLADTFDAAVSYGYLNYESLDSLSAILVMLAYTFQIYFDFSGYCDMAIGIGKMFNIDLPLNFNSPYKALTISEFWQRWHITLTRFLTKYVYIPLGGNRKGMVRTCVNVMIVFLLSGFWHGAGWTFVFWGACHGIFMVLNRVFKSFFEKIHPALNWLITFTFVNVMWIFFRAEDFATAKLMTLKVFFWGFGPIQQDIIKAFRTVEFTKLFSLLKIENYYPNILIALYYTVSFLIILGSKNAYERMNDFKPKAIKVFTTAILLIWSIVSLSGMNVFLYFNF